MSRRRWGWVLLGSLAVAVLAPSVYIQLAARGRVVPMAEAPEAPWAIVFGAGLAPGGEPSPILAERLEVARDLWRTGQAGRLLLTGNSDPYHDEIRAMRRYLLKAGLPESAVSSDLEGSSTFDSCWRARSVFGVQRALLVTQSFHLPRALYLARAAGMEAVGVRAGGRGHWSSPWVWRELLARPLAMLDVAVHRKPEPPAATSLSG